MPLKLLIGPIAAATIVTAFWFAAMWRGHQMERGGGKLPRRYEIGFFGYIAALGLFIYFRADISSAKGLDLFGVALAAEGLGIVVTFALVQAFVLSLGRPWRERATPIALSLLLAGGMTAATLAA